jgi:hypothetical protein
MLLILLGSRGCDWFWAIRALTSIGLGRIGALTSFGSRSLASELPQADQSARLARTTTRRSAALGGCSPPEREAVGGLTHGVQCTLVPFLPFLFALYNSARHTRDRPSGHE